MANEDYNEYKGGARSCLLIIVLSLVVGGGVMLYEGRLVLSIIIWMVVCVVLGIPYVAFLYKKYRKEKEIRDLLK